MEGRKKSSNSFWKGCVVGSLVIPSILGVAVISEHITYRNQIESIVVMSSEESGLPRPFRKEIVDYSHSGQCGDQRGDDGSYLLPFDTTRVQSLGPMGYTVSERIPTDEEVRWYEENSQSSTPR